MNTCDNSRHDCRRMNGWRSCHFQEDGLGEVPRFCFRHWGEWGEDVMRMNAREIVKLMEESSVFMAGIYEERNPPQLDKIPVSEATLAGVRDLIAERRGR